MLNIALCGDWAGNGWFRSGAAKRTGFTHGRGLWRGGGNRGGRVGSGFIARLAFFGFRDVPRLNFPLGLFALPRGWGSWPSVRPLSSPPPRPTLGCWGAARLRDVHCCSWGRTPRKLELRKELLPQASRVSAWLSMFNVMPPPFAFQRTEGFILWMDELLHHPRSNGEPLFVGYRGNRIIPRVS